MSRQGVLPLPILRGPPFLCGRITGMLLGRLTHHVQIMEKNGDGRRLKHDRNNAACRAREEAEDPKSTWTLS